MVDNEEQTQENEIHYIYDDQGYILNQDDLTTDLRDLLYTDGSRAILVDGQYLVTDSPAILLREDDANFQYYVDDNTETFVDNLSENVECVQYVENDDSTVQQIIYYAQDPNDVATAAPVHQLLDTDVESIRDEDGNVYPFKRIKLEMQSLNFEETPASDENSVEYAIVDDADHQGTSNDQLFDLSKITGRNLITGQTVTLHSYMEKLKKRLKSSEIVGKRQQEKNNDEAKLDDLLDKKIPIGKTKSGKNLVARIIHVEKKTNDVEKEDDVDDHFDEVPNEDTKIVVKKSSVSRESFEQISKTLGGVMEMESVRKKLENKNLVVKLVEKHCEDDDSVTKTTSYSYGYMERDSDEVDRWKFTPDQDTQDALLGDHFADESDNKSTKFSVTTSLTIVVSHEKGGHKTIRVNLNPAPGNLCTICAQFFKSNLQLRLHMHSAHNTYGARCEACDESFDDADALKEHREAHVREGRLFVCDACDKCFTSKTKLQKHRPAHDPHLRPLECSVCNTRCASEWALKKHLLTHTGFKPFACDVCGKQFVTQYDVNFHKRIHFPEKHFACEICLRTFSRHSNLLRHAEIHKGTGALYKCDICCCSYNYISSLTRHMVQNHVGETDFLKKARKVQDAQ